MNDNKGQIGMIGLGVMGRNLLLNMADHGYSVVGYDKDPDKIDALRREGRNRKVQGAGSIGEFLSALERPRTVMLLVPAGKIVDSVIDDLTPELDSADLVIDGGNSHFKDTDRRSRALADKGLHFMGMGISGGEKGARFGPSMMPGGPKEAWNRVQKILEAVSAHVDGDPCVTWLGPGSAGHYVKMVHNGIEYGIMQLIAETYHLMKQGLGLTNAELHEVYARWNDAELQSYLVEITADIFRQPDDRSDSELIDMILDEARQKGTGKWTSQDAMDLQVPVPTIDTAVAMRDLSGFKPLREKIAGVLNGPAPDVETPRDVFITQLRHALYFAMITTYAQGMALLHEASGTYDYQLKLNDVARIWRGGCIIRAGVLEDIRTVFSEQPKLENLLLAGVFREVIETRQADIRRVVRAAVAAGIPAPGLAAALSYYDAFRSRWLPANLVQAQRDYFGSHTYERIDADGVFHTRWDEK